MRRNISLKQVFFIFFLLAVAVPASGEKKEAGLSPHEEEIARRIGFDKEVLTLLKEETREPIHRLTGYDEDGYQIMADDVSNEDVIAKLREWGKGSPFEIIGAENDWIEIEFKKLPKNLKSFVEDLEDFCPDAVEDGAGAEEELVKELQKNRRLYLWWD